MLGWIIAGHDSYARDMLDELVKRLGPQSQCCTVSFEKGLSTNMLARMMCDALHVCDSGDGVIFITDITGEAPYRAAALLSDKHDFCEVISGASSSLLCTMSEYRTSLSSHTFREQIVAAGGESVTSLWHQQQKNPPFVLIEREYQ